MIIKKRSFQITSSIWFLRSLQIMKYFILFFLFLSSFKMNAQSTTLEKFAQFFQGDWKSVQEACVGMGKADRSYQMIVENNYLHVINSAYFESDTINSTASVHEDWGIMSYDVARDDLRLHEFVSEGFVLHYLLDDDISTDKIYIFHTESIENIPSGWKARLTIQITGENTFEELFEVAAPHKEYSLYVKSVWEKK